MIRELACASVLLGGLLLPIQPVLAQDAAGVHVSVGDLDLTRPDDVNVLHRRLERAITQVCGANDGQDSVRSGATNACRDDARLTVSRMANRIVASAHRSEYASATPIR